MSNSSPARARVLALALCTAAAVGVSAQSLADGAPRADAPLSVRVHVGDLDLTTRAGVETLYTRIHNAAHVVCGPYEGGIGVAPFLAWRKCVDHAMDSAIARVGNADLTAYRLAKTSGHARAAAAAELAAMAPSH